MKTKERLTILLAEDNDGHARLLRLGLEEAGVTNAVIRFKDGQEAWDYISGKSEPCFEPDKPYLLLLDIRMPKLDGIEVLRRVRADRSFKDMPVIMLTTTDEPKDSSLCYELGCRHYFIKPIDAGKIAMLVK